MIRSFRMALRSISSNKLRSILTMLGIIIGVLALVVLVSLVNGATGSVTNAVSDLGNSLITVQILDDKGAPITLDTISQWEQTEEDLGSIAPYDTAVVTARNGSQTGSVTLYGTTPAYYGLQSLQLSMGRWIKNTDLDNQSYVCILNDAAATELVGYADCIGEEVTLNGVKFTVVGVLAEDSETLTSMLTAGSMAAYVPYTSLVRLVDSVPEKITSFYVGAPVGGTVDATEDALDDLLLDRFENDEDAYSLSSLALLEDAMDSITSVLSILLGGIAAISLIVGGIGIMNIMLVTVTERTREIGIRKAIGASRTTILTQFLMEAVVLCMMGCALGIFLSWGILQLVTAVTASVDLVFTLDAGVVTLSVIFCFLIGVVFGLYPANKAAKMKPIDALHYGG